MDVPLELLLGNQAKACGCGAVTAPGIEIDELDSSHRQEFSHSLRRADNLPIVDFQRRDFLPPVILSAAKDLCSSS